MRQAIHQLKYRNLRAPAQPLAELLHRYLVKNPLPGEVLVPLHAKRLRERGYNQAKLLAREMSKLSGLPLVDGCLIRKTEAPPQARAETVAERCRNVADAFSCRNQRLKDKPVLLIDDVATSGATFDACARAVKAGGASSVWGVVLAREI